MAKNAKRAQLSATIPADLKEALEEYRWSRRMNLSELVETALTEFAVNNDLIYTESDDVVDDDDTEG